MLPVSELPLLVEKRVVCVKISDLLCLASGHNSNLASENMADLQCQGISVDGKNYPVPENILVPKNPLTPLEAENSWILEGIIFPRRSKTLHIPNDTFRNYSCK